MNSAIESKPVKTSRRDIQKLTLNGPKTKMVIMVLIPNESSTYVISSFIPLSDRSNICRSSKIENI